MFLICYTNLNQQLDEAERCGKPLTRAESGRWFAVLLKRPELTYDQMSADVDIAAEIAAATSISEGLLQGFHKRRKLKLYSSLSQSVLAQETPTVTPSHNRVPADTLPCERVVPAPLPQNQTTSVTRMQLRIRRVSVDTTQVVSHVPPIANKEEREHAPATDIDDEDGKGGVEENARKRKSREISM